MTQSLFSFEQAPYVIAELSGNHNGDIERAFAIMEAAKTAGANAVKLQTYTADTMTIDHHSEDFLIHGGPWDGYQLYNLYQEAHTPWEWHEALFAKGKQLGITVFSTPFDNSAVDFLEKLDAPFYKIASFELTDINLIEYVAKTNKPIIMSTGLASFSEIEEAVTTAKKHGCNNLTLLHCISSYPAETKDFNLRKLTALKKQFNVNVGISDHTIGTTVAVAAVGLGATVFEKHLTLARADGGVDAGFSAEPHELKQLCEQTRIAWEALGNGDDERPVAESENKAFRRSIYPIRDIQIGEQFSEENVRCIRPGHSLSPKHYKVLLESKANRFISKGSRLTLSDTHQ